MSPGPNPAVANLRSIEGELAFEARIGDRAQTIWMRSETPVLPGTYRRRRRPGPAPTVRLAVVIPVWRQGRYLASAVRSALDQEVSCGVGIVIVNDGCPDPETEPTGTTLRDADPNRVAYLSQPNAGVAAARNAGIRHAFARWPEAEAVFPLDADNLLSPQTLAKLWELLQEHPEAAWATPAMEFFGAKEGEWAPPGPYLPYRQLFENQCDTGSLIRRDIFAAVIAYDETMRYGFEDWEMFLRATLAGFGGLLAGRCGFRYRYRPESMLAAAQQRAERLGAEIRLRHAHAYDPGALARREHAEAPRFALVRCDRDDVLLTASCDLEPRRLGLTEFARGLAAAGGEAPRCADHVPPIVVLSSAATIDRLEREGSLARALFALQTELRGRTVVGLGGGGADRVIAAFAVRASALVRLHSGGIPEPEALVEADAVGSTAAGPLPQPALRHAAAVLGTAAETAGAPSPISNLRFLERLHIDRQLDTPPTLAAEAA